MKSSSILYTFILFVFIFSIGSVLYNYAILHKEPTNMDICGILSAGFVMIIHKINDKFPNKE